MKPAGKRTQKGTAAPTVKGGTATPPTDATKQRPPRLRSPDLGRLPVQRPMRESEVPKWSKNPTAFSAAQVTAWREAVDYWDGFIKFDAPTSAIASILFADDAGCYPLPIAQEWLIKCLRRWNRSLAGDKPLSLDQAFGLAAPGPGGEPAIARVVRLKRDRFLATNMAMLTALGASDAWAAEMVAVEAAAGKYGGPSISAVGIVKAWPKWRRADNADTGYLRFAATLAKMSLPAERERYLSGFSLSFRATRKRRSK